MERPRTGTKPISRWRYGKSEAEQEIAGDSSRIGRGTEKGQGRVGNK
jgi:hypothetical protein